MKELLQYILENIVDKDSFTLEEEATERGSNIKIKVNKDTIGLVIGKAGKTIKALQEVLRTKAKLENTSVYLTVEEN